MVVDSHYRGFNATMKSYLGVDHRLRARLRLRVLARVRLFVCVCEIAFVPWFGVCVSGACGRCVRRVRA